jgi:predicted choloylglycine hydrolase
MVEAIIGGVFIKNFDLFANVKKKNFIIYSKKNSNILQIFSDIYR